MREKQKYWGCEAAFFGICVFAKVERQYPSMMCDKQDAFGDGL
ncbi:MAG: hypothetical protein PUD23_09200 [Prevotella sp.]|nr:hypothetical protein [Prevotella sp.]